MRSQGNSRWLQRRRFSLGLVTTLPDRPNSAVIVIDVQNGVVNGAHQRDAVVANIAALVERARSADVPVVWVQHVDDDLVRGTEGWQIVPELKPEDGESVVEKHYGDAFEDTTLESVMSELAVGKLIVTGAETDACIRSTLHGAFVRGYDALLVSDAHTNSDKTQWGAPAPADVISHTNLYWSFQSAPGRTAGAARTAEVDFAAEA
jgi:nicotinamidase-related amidase